MTTETETKLINLTIDGKAVSVPKGTTVFTAAKGLGIDIPIFCYQDRMPPFGACRMCLVEVEKMPKLQTSCTLEVTEGMVVHTQSKVAVDGREGILEFLLINHPLDCPICDRGGECPLQDQTLKHGPGESRFFEDKRHFTKALPLGPVLMLDRERCIVCARCTRFGEVVAGDHALEFIDRGYKTEVGTPDGKPVDSKYIGNTIMICPVGALTSQVYRFRARPWDNDPTDSTCTLCPVGCSMILDSRDGEIMRTRSRENPEVNDIWLCDKGWFGYEFTDNPARLLKPLVRKGDKLETATWEEALSLIAKKMIEAKPEKRLAALGGNPLTFEENYLFQKLMRDGLGVNNLDHRVGMPIIDLKDEGIASGMEITPGECEKLSYVMLLGIDITEEFPVIWLRLKQAINNGAKVFFAGHYAPEAARYFSETVLHAPGKELEILDQHLPQMKAYAESGTKGAILVGSQYLSSPNRNAILSKLVSYKKASSGISLSLLEGRGNSMGARFAGMRPDIGPLGEHIKDPGLNVLQLLEEIRTSGWDFLYVAGSDPAVKYPKTLWKDVRSRLKFLVVQDIFLTETAKDADVVLPTLSYVEKLGSFVNIEGRVQKIRPGKDIPENIYSDGEIFTFLAQKLNLSMELGSKISEAIAKKHLPIREVEMFESNDTSSTKNIEGGLKATFAQALFDHGTRMKHNPHLVELAKDPRVRLNPKDGSSQGLKSGDTVKISAKGKSIFAKIQIDENVAEGAVVLPLGFEEVPVQDLSLDLQNSFAVEIALVQK